MGFEKVVFIRVDERNNRKRGRKETRSGWDTYENWLSTVLNLFLRAFGGGTVFQVKPVKPVIPVIPAIR